MAVGACCKSCQVPAPAQTRVSSHSAQQRSAASPAAPPAASQSSPVSDSLESQAAQRSLLSPQQNQGGSRVQSNPPSAQSRGQSSTVQPSSSNGAAQQPVAQSSQGGPSSTVQPPSSNGAAQQPVAQSSQGGPSSTVQLSSTNGIAQQLVAQPSQGAQLPGQSSGNTTQGAGQQPQTGPTQSGEPAQAGKSVSPMPNNAQAPSSVNSTPTTAAPSNTAPTASATPAPATSAAPAAPVAPPAPVAATAATAATAAAAAAATAASVAATMAKPGGQVIPMPTSAKGELLAAKTMARPSQQNVMNDSGVNSMASVRGDSKATVHQNIQQLTTAFAKLGLDSPKLQTAMTVVAQMANNPQTAQVALQLTNAIGKLMQINPQAAANIAQSIATVPQQNMVAFSNLVSALPSLNVSQSGMVMLTAVIGNVPQHISPQLMDSFSSVLQTLSSRGQLDILATDLNKMAALQALLVGAKGKEMSPEQLLALIGPLIKSANGDDEDFKKLKKEQQQALERMIQFLDTYVGSGFAIWAEQMNLDKEQQAFLEEQQKAKQQLSRQMLLMTSGSDDDDSNDPLFSNHEKEFLPAFSAAAGG